MSDKTEKLPTVPFLYQGKQCGEYNLETKAAYITDPEVMKMLKKEQSKKANISVGYQCNILGEPDSSPTEVNYVSIFDSVKSTEDSSSEE